MEKIKSKLRYFTKGEWILWGSSVMLILIAFFGYDRTNYMTLAASLLGVTSLIYCAKGNPIGQIIMIVFCVLYGIISYSFAYYGEMITYLGMSGPMAIFSLIAWVRNPYRGNKSEVTVNRLKAKEILLCMIPLTIIVTIVFYFVLKAFGTANLIPGTVSVTTSFAAVYLTFRRSPFFALAYAANDVVLIVLWVLATLEDLSYLSVTICFAVFLVNDLYGFYSWRKMQKRQQLEEFSRIYGEGEGVEE